MDTRYPAEMRSDHAELEYNIISGWVQAGALVLDLGCGSGELLSLLINNKDARVQGIEIDEKAIQKCVTQGLNVFQQDIETGLSEYTDRSFDYVILSQTMQQVRKLDFVITEALRVGKKVIVSFPNFVNYKARFQIFFKGKVPVTPALPYTWYDTPNLHFLAISDFVDYCRERAIRIEDKAFARGNSRIRILPNLLAETGIFLLSRENATRKS